ncbi:unnamed protein product [Eruca vesicaria subsp. sativa]|uniref:CRIB domain-containing protein n=1 Tax=Eruca vesicaria subsp. sativa TaxID=29727 RepID=A0ABC8JYA9_ERUVS|nr:unnamed protein product [Eruca vesicaria subsp. sativa]
MSNYKMKSFLKGFRYISQIFEYEKEQEMQIGNPTDVKHVAHIGWDGGSVKNQNSPSWMNDFKASGGSPLGNYIIEDASCISEDSTRSRDIPRSSRDGSNKVDSPIKGRSRRGTLNPSGNPKTSRRSKETCDNPSRKSRRKRTKDSGNGGSSRSSCRTRGSQTESIMSDAETMISISSGA